MQSDGWIKIDVGKTPTQSRSFLVQRSRLEHVSDAFDINVGEETTLRFEDDELEAWRVLLYWISTKQIPDTLDDNLLLVKCWVLGQKRGIVAFQNSVMISLLRNYGKCFVEMEEINYAFHQVSEEGWQLQKLMAEELVILLDHDEHEDRNVEQLDACDGAPGLIKAFVEAHERFATDEDTFFRRFEKREGKHEARWKEFLREP